MHSPFCAVIRSTFTVMYSISPCAPRDTCPYAVLPLIHLINSPQILGRIGMITFLSTKNRITCSKPQIHLNTRSAKSPQARSDRTTSTSDTSLQRLQWRRANSTHVQYYSSMGQFDPIFGRFSTHLNRRRSLHLLCIMMARCGLP